MSSTRWTFQRAATHLLTRSTRRFSRRWRRDCGRWGGLVLLCMLSTSQCTVLRRCRTWHTNARATGASSSSVKTTTALIGRSSCINIARRSAECARQLLIPASPRPFCASTGACAPPASSRPIAARCATSPSPRRNHSLFFHLLKLMTFSMICYRSATLRRFIERLFPYHYIPCLEGTNWEVVCVQASGRGDLFSKLQVHQKVE